MEALNSNVIYPLREFAKDSVRLYNKCSKPTKKEFIATAKATAWGFVIMGAIGFFVKLVHIPVNGILVGGPLTA
jgi:protein transport protein SEC61 subunit gamma-like protein